MLPQLLDLFQIVSGNVPIDLGAGALTGDYVSLKNYHTCSILFFKDVGTTDEDTTLTLRQAKTVAGGSVKDLTFNRYGYKSGADLAAVGTFTRVTDNNAATLVLEGELQKIVIIEVPVREMDIANGFDCITLTTSDPGTTGADLGCFLYFLGSPRFDQSTLPSAIVD